MHKRKVTDETLRELVIARRSKGWAFSRDGEGVHARVTREINALSREEIFQRFPEYTYDVQGRKGGKANG